MGRNPGPVGPYKLKKNFQYCSRCKTTEGPFTAYSKKFYRKFYHCRPCNAARLAAYRKTAHGRERVNANARASYRRHPRKWRARARLAQAVRSGRLKKPTHCRICPQTKIEAHHENYNKPLDVLWFCRPHHVDYERGVLQLSSL